MPVWQRVESAAQSTAHTFVPETPTQKVPLSQSASDAQPARAQ
jgi:hypothetical protein